MQIIELLGNGVVLLKVEFEWSVNRSGVSQNQESGEQAYSGRLAEH